MIRLLLYAALLSYACRLISGRWPWELMRPPQTRAQALFNARKLLSVSADASREEILSAHRRLIAMIHPDKGGTNAQAREANAARDLLLDELPYES